VAAFNAARSPLYLGNCEGLQLSDNGLFNELSKLFAYLQKNPIKKKKRKERRKEGRAATVLRYGLMSFLSGMLSPDLA
jgi:hypothetical protein